ncbi:MAG: hypothetical protein KJ697_03850 [Nanoarchaeota archaeon]|nr:hypothetical protein [Nanoarchaeota archaeon]
MGESDGGSDYDLASRDKGYRCSRGFRVPISINVKKETYEIRDDIKCRKVPKDRDDLISFVAIQTFERDAYGKPLDMQWNDDERKSLICHSPCVKKGLKTIDASGRDKNLNYVSKCTCLKTPMNFD